MNDEQLAVSPETFGRMIERKRTWVYAQLRAGTITSVMIGGSQRIPVSEAHRIVREGLPTIKRVVA